MRTNIRAIAWLMGIAGTAHAGGFGYPDNGTEALGRGGAFVAKADDGTALYYNLAGLARQRGTRITIDANLILHDMAFTRAGMYPGDADPKYAGLAYPTIHDGESLFLAPFLGVSTQFGYFKRWTLGLGVYGPPSVGKHSYGVTNDTEVATVSLKLKDGTTGTAPAPSRYDVTRTDLLIIFPTLGLGFQVNDYLDVGAAIQLVYAHFDLANANYTPLGCGRSGEGPDCDAYGRVKSSAITWSYMLSLLAHPTEWMDIGFNFRPQIDIHTTGTIVATPPPIAASSFPKDAKTSNATFDTRLPAYIQLGLRLASHYVDGTERADIEVDGTWENWGSCRDRQLPDGSKVCERGDHLGASNDRMPLWQGNRIDADVIHGYKDTFGVRVGGAWNFRLGDRNRLIARAGFFFDSASTEPKDTRLDFNTLDKYGFTVGAGFKFRGITLNVAYAYIYSPSRDVTDSEVRGISALTGTTYTSSDPNIYGGNGHYAPSNQILSIGLSVNFNEFKRPTLFAH